MTAAVHHRRLARSELCVVSASGTSAAFVAELSRQAELSAHRVRLVAATSGPSWRRVLIKVVWPISPRSKSRSAYRGLRLPGVVALLLGVLLSAYFLNAGSVSEHSNKLVGGSSLAAAGCPFIPLPDTAPNPFGDNIDLKPFKQSLNNFCDALGNFAKNLKDHIPQGIKDGLKSAFNQNRFCFSSRVALSPEDPNQGLNSLMTRGVGFLFGSDKGNSTSPTTWNQYGTAGATWNTYFLDCWNSGGNETVNYAANFIFDVSKVFSVIAILLFQETFNNQIVDYFFVAHNGAPQSPIDTILQQLNVGIYVNFFAVAVVLGALILLYNNVLRGNGLSDALGKIGIMVAVAAFAAVFVSQGSSYVQKANAYTNEVGASVLSALTGTSCTDSAGKAITTTPYDCAAQTMYDALVFRPWASGYIGELEVLNNPRETQARRALAMKMLQQNAYSSEESAEIARTGTSAQRFIDAKQQNRKDMVLGWGARFIAKDGQPATTASDPNSKFDPNSWRPYSHVETDRPEYWNLWSGGAANQQMVVATLALIASFAMGTVLITLTAAYLVLQLLTVLLAIVAPIIFLIGLVPKFGLPVVLHWGETFMQLFLKRIALVVFVGVLLAMLHIVFALALPWWMQLILVLGVAIAGRGHRRQFTNWASSGMRGMGNVAEIGTGGVRGIMHTRRSLKQARQGWRSSDGLALNERVGVAGRSGYAGFDR
ncbi:MAG: hypothetical protein DLM55_07430 [Acidimicrobiales bacterium]|nr:MAG: hypothetical protein DLM55_07430 [Acidimicrobiales bacterium]